MSDARPPKPVLPVDPSMADFQQYIRDLEALHGWVDVDLVHNVFLMVEEVGELAKGIRKYEKLFGEDAKPETGPAKENVAEEIVDVFNYLLAIANRLDIDVEAAFRAKNGINVERVWT
ncbi:MAG: NTP pyrophosphatase (non-canonical NTP hydrolase) [Bradymonadia bacterium]|jgi:NTP pyrophosphatase (non-canonical NTP hydrolase)